MRLGAGIDTTFLHGKAKGKYGKCDHGLAILWQGLKVFQYRFALPLARTNDDRHHAQALPSAALQ
jgi:hypothetical protein